MPVEQGVAAWASLDRDARSRRASGDPRSLSQLRADTFIQRLTGQATATAVPIEIGLTLTTDALLGTCDTPAMLSGYGPLPAEFARDLAAMGADVGNDNVRNAGVSSDSVGCGGEADRARVFVRRILPDPIDHTVVTVDTHRRRFDGPLARYLMARDQHCRMPYCTAPIRHLDHVQPWRDGGPTTAANGQGLCERHSYVKEAPGWHVQVIEPDPGTSRHSTIIRTPTGHAYQSQAPPAHN